METTGQKKKNLAKKILVSLGAGCGCVAFHSKLHQEAGTGCHQFLYYLAAQSAFVDWSSKASCQKLTKLLTMPDAGVMYCGHANSGHLSCSLTSPDSVLAQGYDQVFDMRKCGERCSEFYFQPATDC